MSSRRSRIVWMLVCAGALALLCAALGPMPPALSLAAAPRHVLAALPPNPPIGLTATPASWTNATPLGLAWTNPPQTTAPIAAKWYKVGSVPKGPADGVRVDGSEPKLKADVSADGTQTIYVWLEDEDGRADQTKRASVDVYVDRTAPARRSGCG